MPTCSLNHSTANWVTGCQVFVVLHSIPVPLEIVGGVADGFPLLSLQTTLGRLVPQTSDHRVHLSFQEPLQTLLHPLMRLALLGPLLEEAPRHFPQPFHNMK